MAARPWLHSSSWHSLGLTGTSQAGVAASGPSTLLGGARGTGDKPPAGPSPPPCQRLSQGVGLPRTWLAWGSLAGHGAHGLGAARPSAAGCSQGAAEPSQAAQASAHREKSHPGHKQSFPWSSGWVGGRSPAMLPSPWLDASCISPCPSPSHLPGATAGHCSRQFNVF